MAHCMDAAKIKRESIQVENVPTAASQKYETCTFRRSYRRSKRPFSG